MISFLVLLIEFIIMAFLKASGVDGRPMEFILVCIGVFTVVYFWEIGRSKRLRPMVLPLVIGYLLRIGLIFFDRYGQDIYNLPNSGADSEMFYRTATQFANFGWTDREGLFIRVLGTAMSWLGDSRVYMQFLLALLSVVAIHTAERIMEEARLDLRSRVSAMSVLCLLPNFAILSSILLRESVVTMFLAISLLCFMKWLMGKPEPWFWLAFAFVFAASAFHSGSVALAVGYILVRFLYDKNRGSFRLTWKNILPSVIFLMVFVYLFNNYGEQLFAKMMGVDSIEDIASGSGLGGSSYARYVGNSETIGNMLRYTPARLVFFLFSPFPWHWRGLADIIAFFFNSLFYIWSMFSALRYVTSGRGKNRELVTALLIVAFCALFVFAWGTSNTGTAIRHRDKMVVLYCVMLALTEKNRKVVVRPKPIQNRR